MAAQRVLVVDDEPAVLGLVSKALSSRGYEVHGVCNASEALELAKRMPSFDLVVSDVIMPGMCGPALVRELALLSPQTAIVMMSAHIGIEALPLHAGFLSKPFRVADLFSTVERALAPRLEVPPAPLSDASDA